MLPGRPVPPPMRARLKQPVAPLLKCSQNCVSWPSASAPTRLTWSSLRTNLKTVIAIVKNSVTYRKERVAIWGGRGVGGGGGGHPNFFFFHHL